MKKWMLLLAASLWLSHGAFAAMSASSMKAKVMAAYAARTGKTMSDDQLNVLVDICTGVVQEIQQNAVVSATGPDPQGGTQTVTGTVQ